MRYHHQSLRNELITRYDDKSIVFFEFVQCELSVGGNDVIFAHGDGDVPLKHTVMIDEAEQFNMPNMYVKLSLIHDLILRVHCVYMCICCTYVVPVRHKKRSCVCNSLIFSVAGAGLEPATFGL